MFGKQMDKGALISLDMKQGKYKFLYLCIMAVLIIWCVGICLFPIIWLILSGFKTVEEIYAIPATFFPKKIEISKLFKVWVEMRFWETYGNTFLLAGGAAIFNMLFSGWAGYALSKIRPKGTTVFNRIVFLIMLLPTSMSIVPVYMTIIDFPVFHFNMSDTFWPMWLMAVNAFDIILFKNFFDGISSSILEAAMIDGATHMKIFLKIIIPLSVPVFCVVGIFTFNGNIGSFFMPLLTIKDKNKMVLAVKLFKMNSGNYSQDYKMLATIFSIIPQIVIFAIFQKQIMGGVNVGGVKG